LYVFIAFNGILLIVKALEYLRPHFGSGFLYDKKEVFDAFYKYPFYLHIFSSPIILLTGLFQFSKKIRVKYRKIHQYLGFIYIFLILSISSPSGFCMSFYAFGGIYSIISFIILSVLWWYFTFKAFYFVKQKNYIKHERMMYRSYLLTLSAIVLRLLLFFGNQWFLEIDSEVKYMIISWLSWLPSLLFYELYLSIKN
jgi:uncharacterized membrane protein